MFLHNLKYSLKTLFRSKALIFWTFAFPIILGTFFKMAFSDIENSEKLDIINIAIINNEEFNNDIVFKNTFKELSDKNSENYMFNIKYTTLEESKKLLEEEKITAYILFKDNNIDMSINKNGINETVTKYVIDEVQSKKTILTNIITKELENNNYEVDYTEIVNLANGIMNNSKAKFIDKSRSNLSYTMIEYYTLIAMACLYGSMLSMYIINYILPNMNSVGKRVSISAAYKSSLITSCLIASYIVQIIGIAILFLYTIFVLKVDYGNHIGKVILLMLAGSLAGLSLGVSVSTIIKTNENAKTGILVAITMIMCFLSGMMGITMKYIIDKNAKILNIINPANMITDGFYSLYYYDTFNRYYFNIISLIIFSILMILISYSGLRRQKYDSI